MIEHPHREKDAMEEEERAFHIRRLKSTLQRRGAGAGLAVMGITLLGFALGQAFIAILRGLGMYDLLANREFGGLDPTVYYVQYGLLYLLTMVLPFVILMICFRIPFREVFYFEEKPDGRWAPIIMGGFGVALVLNVPVRFFLQALHMVGLEVRTGAMPYSSDPVDVVLYGIILAVLPAFAEEFCYRGVVLGLLRPFGDGFAILGSAFLFGVMHGNIVQIPFAFCVGLIFGYITVKTGSMWCAVILHFLNNGVSFFQQVIAESCPSVVSGWVSYGTMALSVACALAGLRWLLKKDPDFFRLKRRKSLLSEKAKFGYFVCNIGMLGCLATEIARQIKWW
jgi:membrane protease YdiL (CAAX protease family)